MWRQERREEIYIQSQKDRLPVSIGEMGCVQCNLRSEWENEPHIFHLETTETTHATAERAPVRDNGGGVERKLPRHYNVFVDCPSDTCVCPRIEAKIFSD